MEPLSLQQFRSLNHGLKFPRLSRARKEIVSITTVIKRQTGGSQSRLVRCDDGKLYVLKTHPNPQGPNVLANEALGATLMEGLGLIVPPWRPVRIDLRSLHLFPELAMETATGHTLPACGIHFGSEFVGSPEQTVFDYMPQSQVHRIKDTAQFLPVYLFDVWTSHQDERQCLFRGDRVTRMYEVFFIDNGHLFGGPDWRKVDGRPKGNCSTLIQPPSLEDPRIQHYLTQFERQIPPLLHYAIDLIPKEWHEHDIYMLYARLLCRLERLRTLVEQEILIGESPRPPKTRAYFLEQLEHLAQPGSRRGHS